MNMVKLLATCTVAVAMTPGIASAAYLNIIVGPTSTTISGGDFEGGLIANGQNINFSSGGSPYTAGLGTSISFQGALIDFGGTAARTQQIYMLPFAGANFATYQLTFSNTASNEGIYSVSGLFNAVGNAPLPNDAVTVAPGASVGFSTRFSSNTLSVGAVPEASSWALMVLGFGAVGYGLRRRKATVSLA